MYGMPASTPPLCLLCKGSLQRCYYRAQTPHTRNIIKLTTTTKKKNCGTDLISPAPPEWSKGFSLWKPKAACRSSQAQLELGTVQRERTHYLQRNMANLQFDLSLPFLKPVSLLAGGPGKPEDCSNNCGIFDEVRYSHLSLSAVWQGQIEAMCTVVVRPGNEF